MQTPEVFGLHGNADIQYYSNATKELWKNLIELQPRAAGAGGGMSRDDFIKQTAQDVLNVIPDPFDLYVIKKEIGIPSPTQIVLLQELERWNQCASLTYSLLNWKHSDNAGLYNPGASQLKSDRMQGGCCHAGVAEGCAARIGR